MTDVFLVRESDDEGETKAVRFTTAEAHEFDGWTTSGDRYGWHAIRRGRTWYYIEQMPLDEGWRV